MCDLLDLLCVPSCNEQLRPPWNTHIPCLQVTRIHQNHSFTTCLFLAHWEMFSWLEPQIILSCSFRNLFRNGIKTVWNVSNKLIFKERSFLSSLSCYAFRNITNSEGKYYMTSCRYSTELSWGEHSGILKWNDMSQFFVVVVFQIQSHGTAHPR